MTFLIIPFCRCELDVWPNSFPITREELLKRIAGKDGVFCLITEKIDKEVLELAGFPFFICVLTKQSQINIRTTAESYWYHVCRN